MKKLWAKGTQLDSFVESFETAVDLSMDQKLIPYEIEASLAHVTMLQAIGMLTQEELSTLRTGLNKILELEAEGNFKLEIGDEDMHSKIENFLTDTYGSVGEKLHTARSRNEVITAMRLYSKAELTKIQGAITELITAFSAFNKQYGNLAMPGYTHMQKAMPSSVGLWIGSFIAALEDDLMILRAAYALINQSPLGSAAGYGVPIALDSQQTARLLKFQKVQKNPIYCQQSRGKFEATVVASLVQVLLTINKFASDVMLFTTQEFGFFEASVHIATGSSIMPQKKNVDLAELLRSKVHLVLGNYTQLVSLSANLISGYNRDPQETKKPLIESLEMTLKIQAAQILVQNLTPNKKRLAAAMTEELFATEKALQLVAQGKTFRDAYHQIKKTYTERSEKNE